MRLMLLGAYFGPDQILPVASILATIAGLVLIFWGKITALVSRVFKLPRGPKGGSGADTAAGKPLPVRREPFGKGGRSAQ